MGNGFVSSRMKNRECIKNRQKMACVWELLPLPPLNCIDIHVTYVNDLYMYAKLNPTICFHCLCCHVSNTKRSACLPSTSVLADAAVLVYVRGKFCEFASEYMCKSMCVCLCGHGRICVIKLRPGSCVYGGSGLCVEWCDMLLTQIS